MAKKRKMKIEDVLTLKGVSGPKISPDGKQVVYVQGETDPKTKKGAQNLWRVSVETAEARQLTFTVAGKNIQPAWSPDGSSIAFLSNRPLAPDEKPKDRKFRLWLLPADGGEAQSLPQVKGKLKAFYWAPDSASILVRAEEEPTEAEKKLQKAGNIKVVDRFNRMDQFWVLDLADAKPVRITSDKTHKGMASWSPDSRRIVFEQRPSPKITDGRKCSLHIMNRDGSRKRALVADQGCNTDPTWSPDGKAIAFLRRDEREWIQHTYIAVVRTRGGKHQPVTHHLDRMPGAPIWSADSRSLFFPLQDGVRTHLHRVTVKGRRVTAVTAGNRALNSFTLAARAKRMAFITSTASVPGAVCTADLNGKQESLLVDPNAGLKQVQLGKLQAVHWRSTDGLRVEGLLLLPPHHRRGRRAPLLVMPHGGPHGACTFRFYADFQLLANHGYAVFLPNFRGSSGYGLAFARANRNAWGLGDAEDILAGVDQVVDKGLADPKRLGVFGFSYGGYMTGFLIGKTDRFRAAIAGGGVHNASSFYGTTDIPGFMEFFYEGLPWDAVDNYHRASPVSQVKHIKTPTLIYHGEKDVRVPVSQSEELYAALKRRRVPVEFVRYPDEGHGVGRFDHKKDLLERQLAWFDRYVKRR